MELQLLKLLRNNFRQLNSISKKAYQFGKPFFIILILMFTNKVGLMFQGRKNEFIIGCFPI